MITKAVATAITIATVTYIVLVRLAAFLASLLVVILFFTILIDFVRYLRDRSLTIAHPFTSRRAPPQAINHPNQEAQL